MGRRLKDKTSLIAQIVSFLLVFRRRGAEKISRLGVRLDADMSPGVLMAQAAAPKNKKNYLWVFRYYRIGVGMEV
jgi:hypothetical protein